MGNIIYADFSNRRKENVEHYNADIFLFDGKLYQHYCTTATSVDKAYHLILLNAGKDGLFLNVIDWIAVYSGRASERDLFDQLPIKIWQNPNNKRTTD